MNIKQLSVFLMLCMIASLNVAAQDKDDEKKKEMSVSIGPDGVDVNTGDGTKEKDKRVDIKIGVVDIGLNTLQDNSDYSSTAVRQFLNVPEEQKNENLFNLKQGKSLNVNVWPVLLSWEALQGDKQKIVFGTGIGLQMYNFRFDRPVSYRNEVVPEVYWDSVNTITKNKLGFTYLSVPLMMTFKTRAGDKTWLIYGVGVTGGYRIASWTKQISNERGKQKNHDQFNFNNFNSCLTAEVGLEGYFRLYASYQVTALHEDILDQHPFCIGIRFGGV